MTNNHEHPNGYVKLNVGGKLFHTTKSTLIKFDGMLKTLVTQSEIPVVTDANGWIIIDRSGEYFDFILNFLRDAVPTVGVPPPAYLSGSTTSLATSSSISEEDYYRSKFCYLNEMSVFSLKQLYAEAKFYLIEPMIKYLELLIKSKTPQMKTLKEFTCTIPLLQDPEDEVAILNNSRYRPTVLFSYNRANNKYSYTQTSDDMLLKNIELFDKLTKRFHIRIAFAKDTVVSDDICCWHFYGQGRKTAQINCTTIVYAMEKKQIRIEFPEARIFEETLNVILFEDNKANNNPDSQVMDALSQVKTKR